MKHSADEMATRLMEKLKGEGSPAAIKAEEEAAPCAPPAAHGKMATPPDAPPGIELDAQGNPIPLDQRTQHHKEQAAGKT